MIRLRLNEISEYDVRSFKKYKITLTAVEDDDNSQLLLDLWEKDDIKTLDLEVGCEYELSLKKAEDKEDA